MIFVLPHLFLWAGRRSRYSNWLRAGWSGDRIPVGARFSAPVQTGPGAHPDSCTMGTGSFLGVKSGRGVTLTPHPLLVPWSRKGRAIPLLPPTGRRPVQSLSACTRVHFTSSSCLPGMWDPHEHNRVTLFFSDQLLYFNRWWYWQIKFFPVPS